MLKRFVLSFVLLDNFITQTLKKHLFRSRWEIEGKCKMCGVCCQEILLTMTPRQTRSRLFTKIAIMWISWLFDFILLRVDYENNYLAFTCKHRRSDGKCGNYTWRPNICRNFPLVDYFDEPRLLPYCAFKAKLRS